MRLEPRKASFRPWIHRFARSIPDEVARLRFLQAVAPPAAAPKPFGKRWRPLLFVLPALVATPLLSFVLLRATPGAHRPPNPAPAQNVVLPPIIPAAPPSVWQVEHSRDADAYSNGLRIDNRFAVSNHARSYQVFPLDPDGREEQGSQPVGIVFHTTESRQAPFEEQQTRAMQKIGKSLLEYVREERAYHFVVDRFGRVYRIVVESDAANHAGHSVWADDRRLYLNLNESFLAVSVETQTEAGQLEPAMSPAQVRAAAMLTEMLRSRYGIPAVNCVTHAQVSVNPSNMRIGYHTDWASSFPFASLGLPDNYLSPLPALVRFGFEADRSFDRLAGARMVAEVDFSEQQLRDSAAAARLSASAYRKILQTRYRRLAVFLHSSTAQSE
jgi:N-acetyl-anhydromuramyl-L-alanine amidase AmpD